MDDFVEVVKNVLIRSGHSAAFCSNYQFRGWYQLFAAVKEKQNRSNTVDDYINKMIERPVYENVSPGKGFSMKSIWCSKQYIYGATEKHLRGTWTCWTTEGLNSCRPISGHKRTPFKTQLVLRHVGRFTQMCSTRIKDRCCCFQSGRVGHLSRSW